MKMTNILPSAQYLNECLTYDPQNGLFFWKERPRHHFRKEHGWRCSNSNFAGRVAGSEKRLKDGTPIGINIGIVVDGKRVCLYAHRIAHIMMGVEIPEGFDVDHRDGNSFDNSWENLRICTASQNAANRKRYRNRKHDLPKGVLQEKRGRFRAMIGFQGNNISCGCFGTPEEAHAAYCAKAQELYGEFARSN